MSRKRMLYTIHLKPTHFNESVTHQLQSRYDSKMTRNRRTLSACLSRHGAVDQWVLVGMVGREPICTRLFLH